MSEREPRLEPPTPEDNEPTGSTPEELNIPAIYGESNPMTEVMTCETPGGSWAWYTDQGVGYSKNENQDAIVVDPENEGMAVIDGMGGHPNGTEAAQILAESLDGHLTGIAQIETGQLSAVDRMQNELDSVESGACYLAAHRTGNRLEILYAGDVRLAKYNPDGAHEFSTEDHG